MSIYQHFREEERPFIDQVLEWKADVALQYQLKRSDFLDPREQEIVQSVIGEDENVHLSLWGGHSESERKRACLFPPYVEPAESDFGLTLFQLEYPSKFVKVEHRDVLGALMNLGVKREKFGDIMIDEEIVQLVVASEIADYVEWNLDTVGRAKVKLMKQPFHTIIRSKEHWEEQTSTVSSLRLDAVMSEVYRLSRSKATLAIERGLVKVNWKLIEHSSFLLKEGDHLSVRGYGRSKLLAIEGITKKDKLRIRYGRMQ
ncbi:YlmH family RNA-binding protein [Halalkalibacterium ligniniphilum]|uniref:YlmH family RNA-binding protein n=1 Tax=Halalkalibacterium ligniniphilum TaxID=1134413 RepID=UPI00034498C3|nr:RNA-binding protein [Halalkalibacterium ligniniphilum]